MIQWPLYPGAFSRYPTRIGCDHGRGESMCLRAATAAEGVREFPGGWNLVLGFQALGFSTSGSGTLLWVSDLRVWRGGFIVTGYLSSAYTC